MGLPDAQDRLNSLQFKDMLGGVGVTSADVVRAIRRVEQNIEKLAAAAWHQQSVVAELKRENAALRDALRKMRNAVDKGVEIDANSSYDAAQRTQTADVARVVDLRMRHSKEPCVECDSHWVEPVKRGRPLKRCPSCR